MTVPTRGFISPVITGECDGVVANNRLDGAEVVTPTPGTPETPNQAAGLMVEGWDEVNQVARVLRMTPAGAVIISIVPGTGTTMQSFPFVVVPPAAVVPLPVPPVGTTEYSFAVIGANGGEVFLVRNTVDPVGSGLPMVANGGNGKIGGFTGAIPAALDVEGLPTNVGTGHVYVTSFGP